mmetsp:Transcript_108521/g.317510  ORF Transcript_108521/g.317510 Transcript_108521/m.317510 type:complete len:186 (-) Transcript_108521:26-583(-)
MAEGDCVMAAPRCPPKLRLPDIRPPPEPSEEEVRLANALEEAAEEKRQRCGSVQWQRRPPNACGRSLEDFLGNEPPGRRRSYAAGGRARQSMRPSQRLSIDDETTVPADLHERMLRLGTEARTRGTHGLAFRPVTGRPFLKRRDDGAEESAEEAAEASLPERLAEASPRARLRPADCEAAVVLAH